ncbi:MAG: hypothetical protein ACRENL_12615 [Candidatus Dormibacteria bacterium]
MTRPTVAPALVMLGGILLIVGLPLQWTTVAATDGSVSISLRGIDYALYDIATTAALGLLLVAAAFALAARRSWGHVLAVVVSLLACFWAGLVVAAAANPSENGSLSPGVTVSIGAGAYVLGAGAALALVGAILTFRRRSVAAVRSAAPSSV